jgi:hypothetical protein
MIGLNKIGLNQVQLNRLRLNAPFPAYGKMAGGGGSGDGFPQLPGDVTRWHFGGLTNEMMAAMDDPRIEDADGKGRFLSFKNFAWGGMSGVGGYSDNFSSDSWKKPSDRSDITWTSSSFNITRVMDTGVQIYYHSAWEESESVIPEKRIIVKGLEDGQVLRYMNVGNRIIEISQDGIYTIPSFTFKGANSYHGYSLAKKQESCNVTVEQLPLYPGFILGDGVDDFAVTEKELNFEDTYTVYTAFIPFQNDPARNMILCGKNDTKDFSINYSGTHLNFKPSTGVNLAVRIDQFALLVCKRNKDITTIINLSTGESRSLKSVEFISNPGLYYLWRNMFATFYAKAAIAGQIIDNGHFTTDEEDENILNWHKKQYPWLFPDQAWTVTGKTNEDEDRATIANITGNGNDLVLSNFGFSGNSGYGLYGENYNGGRWVKSTSRADITWTSYSVNVTSVKIASTQLYYQAYLEQPSFTVPSYAIKVYGLKDGQTLSYRQVTPEGVQIYEISEDGIYTLPSFLFKANGDWYGFTLNKVQESCDITIEQIPEYEGYLVTDGVDDRVQDSSFKLNKDWTLVGEWVLLNQKATNAGIVKPFSFIVYNRTTGLSLFINSGTSGITIENVKSIKAICSDGCIYLDDWSEMLISKDQDITSSTSVLSIGFNGTAYTQIAFKNLGIYNNQILSKEDCIKAYNYLQTLKAK